MILRLDIEYGKGILPGLRFSVDDRLIGDWMIGNWMIALRRYWSYNEPIHCTWCCVRSCIMHNKQINIECIMHKTYQFWWHACFHHFRSEAKNLQQLRIWINYPIYLNYEFKSLQLLQQFGSNCSSVGFKPTPLNISGSVNWAKRNYWCYLNIHWILRLY